VRKASTIYNYYIMMLLFKAINAIRTLLINKIRGKSQIFRLSQNCAEIFMFRETKMFRLYFQTKERKSKFDH